MPIRRMLNEGRTFDPKAIVVLIEAFDGVVAELDLRALGEKERAARIVIGFAAGQTNLDAAKLRAGAVAMMRSQPREHDGYADG